MDGNQEQYIPPLVSGNRLKEYVDHHRTLKEAHLDIGGYIRISTKKDSQLTSIENQKKYITEWAAVNGYRIVRFYTDVKSGAYTYLRNEMQQLREDIAAGRVKGIVSKEISRTSRDIMDILELKRSLVDRGAFFISIKESYDSRTDDDEFLLVIHAGLAQKERKTTSSRVKITQLMKAREGKTNVPSPAYGYRLTEDRQHLEPDPETSPVYRMIVDKYLEGWGQLKICQYLNEKGIPAKRSKRWHTNSIRTILTNPVYLGITIYNATTLVRDSQGRQKRLVRPKEDWVIRQGTHEPLITKERFDRIQETIRARQEKDKKEWSGEKKYLLSGLLFCEVCKGKIYGSRQPSKGKNALEPYYYYYIDQNRYGGCDTKCKYWDMRRVDEIVLQEVKSFFKDRLLIEQRIRAKQYLYTNNMMDEKAERERLKDKLENINHAMRRQQEAYEEDVLSIEEYKTRIAELREQKSRLMLRLDALNQQLEKTDSIEERFQSIREKVLHMIDNIDQLEYTTKETLIRKIIRRVFIRSDYAIRIEYTFEE